MVQLANTTHHHIYHPLFTNPQAIALRFETWQPISYHKYIICLTHIKQEPSIHEPKYTEQRHPTSINHSIAFRYSIAASWGKKRTKWRLLLGRENHKTKPCVFQEVMFDYQQVLTSYAINVGKTTINHPPNHHR